jgi:hypothetical protein
MTWQTILYFSSTLLTFALPGILAWCAWAAHDDMPMIRPERGVV